MKYTQTLCKTLIILRIKKGIEKINTNKNKIYCCDIVLQTFANFNYKHKTKNRKNPINFLDLSKYLYIKYTINNFIFF